MDSPIEPASSADGRDVAERHPSRERLLLGFALVAYLGPIWAFPLVPTQDGPIHLSNAVALMEFGRPRSRGKEFYQVRHEPIPNWTAHASLMALLRVTSPAVADKILASVCIVGLVISYCYFLASFGRGVASAWPLAMLLAYNRNLMMGFYNFSLSLALFWCVLGVSVRRRDSLGWSGVAILAALFSLLYFTHLAGFLLSLTAAAWMMASGGLGRVRRLCGVAAAATPAIILAGHYFLTSGFFGAEGAASGVVWVDMSDRKPALDLAWIATMLDSLDEQLFAAYSIGRFPIGLVTLVTGNILLATALLTKTPAVPPGNSGARWAVAAFGLAVALLYLIVPEHLGRHGGFIHSRLAPLPPMLWLACYRGPSTRLGLVVYRVAFLALLTLNLALILTHFRETNRDLTEFTAAVRSVGEGRTIAAFRDPSDRAAVNSPVDHLLHAVEYYCLSGGNISLENYQATTNHFPLMYKPELPRDYVGLALPIRQSAEVILVWGSCPELAPILAGRYEESRRVGRLTVMKKLDSR